MISPDRIREIARDCEDQSVITSSTNAEDLRALADELEMNQRPQSAGRHPSPASPAWETATPGCDEPDY